MPRPSVLLVLFALMGAVPAVASASEVGAVTTPPPRGRGEAETAVTVTGTAADDAIEISGDGAALLVSDPAGMQASRECLAVSATVARCPPGSVSVVAGAGADRVTVLVGVPTTLNGGAGDDVLTGGPGFDTLIGGAGNDQLDGGGAPATPPGSIYSSTPISRETVRFDDSADPVRVDLRTGRAVRADGTDTLRNFGAVIGGSGPDVMRAPDAGGVVLSGGLGDDRLTGGAGSDQLDGGPGVNVLDGAAGDDLLRGGGRLSGGPGDDELRGRRGADVLIGGPGSDTVLPGGGNDRVRLIGGGIDRVDCQAQFSVGKRMRVDLDAGDGTRGCRGIHRRGAARPAFFPPGTDQQDYVGNVNLRMTCPQPLRNCPVRVEIRRSTGALAARMGLALDVNGLGLGYDLFLNQKTRSALRKAGRLHLTARLEGLNASRRRVVDRIDFVVSAANQNLSRAKRTALSRTRLRVCSRPLLYRIGGSLDASDEGESCG